MKYFRLVLIMIAIFTAGCINNKPSLGKVCNDYLQYDVMPEFESSSFCYDKRGKIDIVLHNYGRIDVQKFEFYIEGDLEIVNSTIKKVFRPEDIEMISFNYNKRLIGNIKRLVIVPTIIYEGEQKQCQTAKFVTTLVGPCDA